MLQFFLYMHIAMGMAGLLTGAVVMVLSKNHRLHSKLGNLYFITMCLAALAAIVLSHLHPNLFLFVVGVFTLYMLLSGKRVIHHYRRTNFYPDYVLTTAMAMAAWWFLGYGVYLLWNKGTFGIVFLFLGWFSIRYVWTDIQWYRGILQGRVEATVLHFQRMAGSYIASATAFTVVNNKILPGPVAWLLPAVLLVPVIIRWTRRERAKTV